LVKILYLYCWLFRFKLKVDSNKVDSNKVEKITKRHKIELSYEIKRKIVNLFKEKCKSQNKYTQTKLIDDLKSELGISLKKSTLSDILKNEDKIANVPDSCDYRDRKAKYPALEDCLYMFLTQLLSNGISVNEDILISKAVC